MVKASKKDTLHTSHTITTEVFSGSYSMQRRKLKENRMWRNYSLKVSIKYSKFD